jgi:hypothetical protein
MTMPPLDPEAAEAAMKTRLLQSEDFIAGILAKRNPPKKTPWWESSTLTSAIVAVVSLLLGTAATIYSQRESNHVQLQVKQSEFTMAERATVRKERADVLSSLHKLIALVMKNTEDRLDVAKGNLNDLDSLERANIVDTTNLADDRWREQKESNDFLIPYYFAGNGAVVVLWSNVRDSLQSYTACAESVFVRYPKRNAPKPSCQERESAARRNIAALWNAVNHSAGINTK